RPARPPAPPPVHPPPGRAGRAKVLGAAMKSIAAILLLAASPAAFAAFNIFASTPEWGALAKELGGEKANVYVASTALQDPHRIEARPSLIARARSADLMVCTGAQLEIGWLPLVQQQSGNTKSQPAPPRHFQRATAASP